MATLQEVSEIVTLAAAVYPNFKMQVGPEAFARAWLRHVGHLGRAELQAAMDRAVRASEFFPTVSDVLKAAARNEHQEGNTALEAWGKVKQAMHTYGNYCPPVGLPRPLSENTRPWTFRDEKITRAVAGLGWEALFDGDEDVMRSHFIRSYDAMTLREMQEAIEPPAPALAAPAPSSPNSERVAQLTAGIGRGR